MGVNVDQLVADFEAYREAVKSRHQELEAEIQAAHAEAGVPEPVQAKLDALDAEIQAGKLDIAAATTPDGAAPADQAGNVPTAGAPADQPSPESNPLNQAADPNVSKGIVAAPVVDGGAAPVGTNFAPEAPTEAAPAEQTFADQPRPTEGDAASA